MTTMLTKQFRVFRGPSAVVNAIGPNVLALAGFDGVHTGHRALLRRAAESAAELGLPVGAATFEQKLARRGGVDSLPALSSLSERLHLLRDAGMDFVVLFPGDPGALGVPEEIFTNRILLGVMKTQLVVVHGPDGDARPSVTASDLSIEAVASTRIGQHSWVSTTRIRDRLGLGDIETVNQLLGRRYELTATVREAAGGHVHATVPPARMIPGLGEYNACVDYTSNGVQSRVRTTIAVRSGGVGRPGQLTIALDQAVDHGRLRIGFIRRAAPGGTGEPPLFEFGTR